MSDPENPEIAALLRDAHADEPMPAEVAARLDAVISGLATDRARGATVVPLHRRVPRLAAAAAALVVLAGGAVAASGLLHRSGGAAETSATAGAARTPPPLSAGQDSTAAPGTDKSVQGLTAGTALPTLRRSHLHADVLALLGGRSASPAPQYDAAKQPAPTAGCQAPAHLPAGATVRPVALDGVPALLVIPRQTGTTVVARVYSCAGSDVLGRTTLPAP